jgi:hypothetical protein
VGQLLSDLSNVNGRKESDDALRAQDAQVIMYDELLENARDSYQASQTQPRTSGVSRRCWISSR